MYMKKIITHIILTIVFLGFFLVPVSLSLSRQTMNQTQVLTLELHSNVAHAGWIKTASGWVWKAVKKAPITAVALTGMGAYKAYDMTLGTGEGVLAAIQNGVVWLFEKILTILSYLVGIIATLVDYFIFQSISSSSYRLPFIERMWEIVRDFTNIIFIFALLVVAFKMVLGMGANAKKTMVKTILIALVINFSLFTTWVIVDASNILAHVFYNKIDAKEGYFVAPGGVVKDKNSINQINGEENSGTKAKSITTSLIAGVNNQGKSLSKQNENKESGSTEVLIRYAFLIVMMIMIGWVLLSVVYYFLARTIGLFVLAIMSPLAFASIAIGKEDIEWIGFNKWLNQLFGLAFMAPIYLFLIYVIVQFTETAFALPEAPGTTLNRLLAVAIPMSATLFFLKFTENITKSLSGKLGAVAVEGIKQGIAGTLGGGAMLAMGAGMAGGIAIAGSGHLLGAGGKGLSYWGRKSDNKYLRLAGTKAQKGGSFLKAHGKNWASAKFDVSRLPGFKQVVGEKNASMIGKITRRSALGHYNEWDKKRFEAGPMFEVETDRVGAEQLALAQKKAQKKANSKSAQEWQKKINEGKADAASAEEIKKEFKDILNDMKKGSHTFVNEAGEKVTVSSKEMIEKLNKEFSESVIVQNTAKNTQGMTIHEAPLPPSMGGGQVTAIPANTSRASFEKDVMETYQRDIKDAQKEVKRKERDLTEALTTKNKSAISAAKAALTKAESDVDNLEKNLEKFSKKTAKAAKEKAKKIEDGALAQAKEVVAQKKEKSDPDAAQRIRSNKVRVDTAAAKKEDK